MATIPAIIAGTRAQAVGKNTSREKPSPKSNSCKQITDEKDQTSRPKGDHPELRGEGFNPTFLLGQGQTSRQDQQDPQKNIIVFGFHRQLLLINPDYLHFGL